jgi:hypothetical protein
MRPGDVSALLSRTLSWVGVVYGVDVDSHDMSCLSDHGRGGALGEEALISWPFLVFSLRLFCGGCALPRHAGGRSPSIGFTCERRVSFQFDVHFPKRLVARNHDPAQIPPFFNGGPSGLSEYSGLLAPKYSYRIEP